ncbi:MAG: type I restriction enzyme HsdR N-terminal domain-containing protein [Chitinophagaceae bacterium]
MHLFHSLNIKIGEKVQWVFSPIRKKWIVLSPEEEVRQKVVLFLTLQKKFPLQSMQEEREFEINGLKKRFDILVYNTQHQPFVLIECKADKKPLNDHSLEQIFSYIQFFKTPYFMFVNTEQCRLFFAEKQQLLEINPIPFFVDL